MAGCEDLGKRINEIAALDAAAMPSWAKDHLASCPTCGRLLQRARVTRGLVATTMEGPEPPADFAQRVLAALPATRLRGAIDPDLWRLGWRLVPAFAATAALVLVLFQSEVRLGTLTNDLSPALAPGLPAGLISEEGLSASEHLVLGATPPDLNLVLAAVMERDVR